MERPYHGYGEGEKIAITGSWSDLCKGESSSGSAGGKSELV